MYPDQSLYPYDSAPKLVEAMNNALLRADQIQHMEIKDGDQKKEKRIEFVGSPHAVTEYLRNKT